MLQGGYSKCKITKEELFIIEKKSDKDRRRRRRRRKKNKTKNTYR
jgi:hypothetical protein